MSFSGYWQDVETAEYGPTLVSPLTQTSGGDFPAFTLGGRGALGDLPLHGVRPGYDSQLSHDVGIGSMDIFEWVYLYCASSDRVRKKSIRYRRCLASAEVGES